MFRIACYWFRKSTRDLLFIDPSTAAALEHEDYGKQQGQQAGCNQ
jgi:hypothetical protein